jgi:lycopene beta-cyclase
MSAAARLSARWFLARPPDERRAWVFTSAWLISMMALPIMLWTLGDAVFPTGITLAALIQAGVVFFMLMQQWGWRAALRAFVLTALLSWAAEWAGSHTGLLFGSYHYTALLQPQIVGVPLLIPVAWFMLLPPSWVIAQQILGDHLKGLRRQIAFAALSALALTAWDLYLDPQMVARGFWIWAQPGAYFGIPWSNYAGWFITAFLITLLIRPTHLKPLPLGFIYAAVWFFQGIGQAMFWGQPGPAFVGLMVMGAVWACALYRTLRQVA